MAGLPLPAIIFLRPVRSVPARSFRFTRNGQPSSSLALEPHDFSAADFGHPVHSAAGRSIPARSLTPIPGLARPPGAALQTGRRLPAPVGQGRVRRQEAGGVPGGLPVVADEEQVGPRGQGLPGPLGRRQVGADGPHLQVVGDDHPVKSQAAPQPDLQGHRR